MGRKRAGRVCVGGNSWKMTGSGSRVGGKRNAANLQPRGGICTYEPLCGPPFVKPASSLPAGACCGPGVGVSPPLYFLSPPMSQKQSQSPVDPPLSPCFECLSRHCQPVVILWAPEEVSFPRYSADSQEEGGSVGRPGGGVEKYQGPPED